MFKLETRPGEDVRERGEEAPLPQVLEDVAQSGSLAKLYEDLVLDAFMCQPVSHSPGHVETAPFQCKSGHRPHSKRHAI